MPSGGRRARYLTLLLAVAAASCLDGPTGPLEVGELKLKVSFVPGEDPAALGVTVDSLRVTANRRTPAEVVVDTVLAYADGATLSWLMNLSSDPETFDAEIELYGDSDTLYAGTASPSVPLGFGDAQPVHQVLLHFRGKPGTSPIAQIVVSPPAATIVAIGASHQYSAQALDASGAVISGVTFAWSSVDESVASVDDTGLATAVGAGNTTIRASAGGVTGSAALAVDLTGSAVGSITVTPATATLNSVGATQQFVADVRDASGGPVSGATVVWSSSDPAVATMDAASGMATAAGAGATTIRASVGSVSGTAALTVDLPSSTIASIVVTPGTLTLISIGATQQYAAEARDAGGQPIPGVVFAWTSTDPSVATVDGVSGLAIASGAGNTTIQASAGGVTGSATLTVDLSGGGGVVASITVTPAAATLISVGTTQQFVADVRDALGGVVSGATVTWSSSDVAVATIDAASGVATAAGAGTSTIRAHVGSVSGTAVLTVDLSGVTIASIVVTPSTLTLGALGVTQQYAAEARNAAGQPIAGVVFAWTSTDPLVAIIDGGSGLATTSGEGSTQIQASAAGVTGSATLAVDVSGNTAVASINVAPPNALLMSLGDVQQFSAVARDANGNIVTSASFAWTSTSASVASIDASTGLATAMANGSTVITASANGVSGTAALDVAQQVASVVVSPDSVRVENIGDQVQFTAAAFDGNGHAISGVVFAWSSSHPIIAFIDPVTGLVTTNDGGIVTITATAQGVSGSSVLVVRR